MSFSFVFERLVGLVLGADELERHREQINSGLIQQIKASEGEEKVKYQEKLHESHKDEPSSKEILDIIKSLDDEGLKSVEDTLRSAYREVSAYTIHYSNVRAALATFFLGGSFTLLFSKVVKCPVSLITLAGPALMVIGLLAHYQLTKFMQSGLKQLVHIEYILSFMPRKLRKLKNNDEDKYAPIPQLTNYFSHWANGLGLAGNSRYDDVSKEPFTKLYVTLFLAYLFIIVLVLLSGYFQWPLFTSCRQ